MKKIKLLLIATIALGVVCASTMADTAEKEKGYISVNQSVTKEISPNEAEITFSIETSDKSLKKASDENKEIATNVYAALKAVVAQNDYLKTSNYSAKPQYSYTKDNKKILDKYVVTNSVTLRTKNLEIVSKLVDIAISKGATNVGNLQFTITSYDESCNEALADLTKKSFSQANAIAKSINAQLLGIKSINATCNPENNSRPLYAMMAKSSLDSVSSTPIESGKIKIYANIDASFYVK